MRQALAGLLWSKQYYRLRRRGVAAPTTARTRSIRRPAVAQAEHRLAAPGRGRRHLHAGQVGVPLVRGVGPGLPGVTLALVDVGFAKQQLNLLLTRRYLHPNGQLPAYEWNFTDVNPPVHAWAALFVYEIARPRPERRPRLPGHGFRAAAAETSPGGSTARMRTAEHLPGRLSRSGQHRRVRPPRAAAAAAARSTRPTGRRGCRCTARTCCRSRSSWPAMIRPISTCRQVARALCWIAAATNHVGGTARACGTRRTGSSTTCCGARRQQHPAEGALARRPDAAGGRDRLDGRRAATRTRSWPRASSEFAEHPAVAAAMLGQGRQSPRGGPRCSRCSTRTGCDGSWPHARRGGVPRSARDSVGLAVARGASVRHGRRRAHATASTIFRPSRTRACSAGTRTGADRCGSRST